MGGVLTIALYAGDWCGHECGRGSRVWLCERVGWSRDRTRECTAVHPCQFDFQQNNTSRLVQPAQDLEPSRERLSQLALACKVERREARGFLALQQEERRVVIREAQGLRAAALMLPAINVGVLSLWQR